ncbi:class I SAM-dependent methyltransferase [Photorhabdus australis]|nr:class I SAM-dependent methyltransferase [Photorhabdus australis]
MYIETDENEFSNIRSLNYRQAVSDIGNIWQQDLQVMFEYLNPQQGDVVLEIGSGSGFFSFPIADALSDRGHLFVTDPSEEQLKPVLDSIRPNMTVFVQGAENISLGENQPLINKIWSRGAFHHVKNKTTAFSRWRQLVIAHAKMVIFDIFSHNDTAYFFDAFVSRVCVTGHEVAFLSKAFAESLCARTGWCSPVFHDIPLRWRFDSEEKLGGFLALLLANQPRYSAKDSLNAAYKYLGVHETVHGVELDWPMTVMVAEASDVTQ